jgi:hypothetical protein
MGACALILGTTHVRAAQIDGSVGFTGTFTGAPINLADATAITFVDPRVETVTPGSALDTTINVGQAVFLASPLNVAGTAGSSLPLPAGGIIYTVGGFTLTLSTLGLTFENASNLILDGFGTLSGNGYEKTSGNINITLSRSGDTEATAAFTFASTSAALPTAVPDGGATAMLLGLGLLGVAGLRRNSVK